MVICFVIVIVWISVMLWVSLVMVWWLCVVVGNLFLFVIIVFVSLMVRRKCWCLVVLLLVVCFEVCYIS